MRLLMVGCGNMGGVMLSNWLQQNILSAVTIVTPSGSPKFADYPLVTAVTNPNQVAKDELYDIVILAVKPQMMDDVLPDYKFLVNPDTVFVTVAAGKSMAYYETVLGDNVPLVRAMPNTPSAIGQGVTLTTANTHVSDVQYKAVTTLLKANGMVVPLADEDKLDKAATISSCGPAYVAFFIECLTHAGTEMGLSAELSEKLAVQTIIGSGMMLDSIDLPVAQQRQNVTSKGGTTAAALAVMMAENGLQPIITKALKNAMMRTSQLK